MTTLETLRAALRAIASSPGASTRLAPRTSIRDGVFLLFPQDGATRVSGRYFPEAAYQVASSIDTVIMGTTGEYLSPRPPGAFSKIAEQMDRLRALVPAADECAAPTPSAISSARRVLAVIDCEMDSPPIDVSSDVEGGVAIRFEGSTRLPSGIAVRFCDIACGADGEVGALCVDREADSFESWEIDDPEDRNSIRATLERISGFVSGG